MVGIYTEKKYLIIIAILIAMTSFLYSCKEEQKDAVTFANDPERVPSIWTDSVDMLISSDSGYIKYRVVTKIWEMYESAKEPFWFFPEKVHLEQYDTLFQVEATVDADSAWNFKKQKLWKLKGNVIIQNKAGEKFLSEEFFWDEKTEKVYSDKFVTVDSPGKMTIYGMDGFEANQQFTNYTFFRVVDSPVTVEEKEETAAPAAPVLQETEK